jgi:anaerobic selenocysteine-containing dehydrogenase
MDYNFSALSALKILIVKTFCARMDHGGCGLLLEVEKEWGYDPLPTFREGKNGENGFSKGELDLILTSAKDPNYFHSAYRNLPSLRKLSSDPEVFLHPDTAVRLNIQEGD